ncbi:KAP family P-loop NTPase fold protein [Aquirufa sp. ROCK2-A2]
MSLSNNSISVDDSHYNFKNCRLNRKLYADNLTQIIQMHCDGFVLAIDNEWGGGKTTFIKMWEQNLKNAEYQTVYFNSWENDLEVDPMVAILAAFKTLGLNDSDFQNIILAAGKISAKALPIFLKGVLSKIISEGPANELFKLITEKSSEFLLNQIDDYSKRKDSIKEFKNKLSIAISKRIDKKPLVFFVDELDRCRPDYAVQVLEKIKHFFNIPGIVFVLAIDKNQLCNSIKGYYGSESINSNEYLRRFIDLEYTLPSPNIEPYTQFLFFHYKLNEFFINSERKNYPIFEGDEGIFMKIAFYICKDYHLNLRLIDKLYFHSSLVIGQMNKCHYCYPSLIFWLVYLKNIKPFIFDKIYNLQYTVQGLIDEFENDYMKLKKENDGVHLRALYFQFIISYFNYYKENNNEFKLFDSNEILTISFEKSNFDFITLYENYKNRNLISINLKEIIFKINLNENLKNLN